MNLLADENLDHAIVAWLREIGHNVEWIFESMPGVEDSLVLQHALNTRRSIITADLDFGEYVFRHLAAVNGIALLRLSLGLESERLALFKSQWPAVEPRLEGAFVVIADHLIRIRPLPR